jgi:hypothetical protein
VKSWCTIENQEFSTSFVNVHYLHHRCDQIGMTCYIQATDKAACDQWLVFHEYLLDTGIFSAHCVAYTSSEQKPVNILKGFVFKHLFLNLKGESCLSCLEIMKVLQDWVFILFLKIHL